MAQSEIAITVRNLEADFAADEDLAKTLAFAADSSDEQGGIDKSMFCLWPSPPPARAAAAAAPDLDSR